MNSRSELASLENCKNYEKLFSRESCWSEANMKESPVENERKREREGEGESK